MEVFPEINHTAFKFKSKKDINKSEYDGGYVQTRPKYTRAVKVFTFTLVSLTQTQVEEIDSFLIANRGVAFYFIHPLNQTTHEVRLLGDLPEFTYSKVFKDFDCSELVLEEV